VPPTAEQARASKTRFYARIVTARAEGKWTDKMEAIWNEISPEETFRAGDAERLDELERLLADSGE
jgi:hypothetical protein